MDYAQQYQNYLNLVNCELENTFSKVFNNNSAIAKASHYSLFSGGKRIRAVLCVAVCDMLCNDAKLAAKYAAAIEMMHCYSLIHDDLPCMDNADMRRGKASCHKNFDEATALLAGDALLTASFEVALSANNTKEQNSCAAFELAKATGTKGMIYGQELDLYFEKNIASEKELYLIHENKTGKLISVSAQLGAIAANASENDKEIILEYSNVIGLVFQIIDDVLDASANPEILGKPTNNDEKSDKTTFVKLFGIEKSIEMANNYTKKVCDLLDENYNKKADFLIEFAKTLVIRNN